MGYAEPPSGNRSLIPIEWSGLPRKPTVEAAVGLANQSAAPSLLFYYKENIPVFGALARVLTAASLPKVTHPASTINPRPSAPGTTARPLNAVDHRMLISK